MEDEDLKECVTSESESESDTQEPTHTCEELTQIGCTCLQQKDFEGAVQNFSWALTFKCRSLPENTDIHRDLAPFYLNYGNALLIKEENSHELFDFGSDEKKAHKSQSISENDKEDVSDEQIAWEVLELARMCYERRLGPSSAGDTPHTDVIDASFVHIRLGDILMLQEKFAEAAQEYLKSITIRKLYDLPYTTLESSTLAYAQALLFSGEEENAVTNFQLALKLCKDHLSGVGGHTVAQERVKDYEATIEDLEIQINETMQSIKTKLNNPNPNPNTNHRLKFLPEDVSLGRTTSTFDKSTLKDEPVIKLGVLSGVKSEKREDDSMKDEEPTKTEMTK